LPFDLGTIGAPFGCLLRVDPTFSVSLAVSPSGTATRTLSIPAVLGPGVTFFTQAMVVDPGVGRPLQLVTSNALQTTCGA
jgi:hypothetical protein